MEQVLLVVQVIIAAALIGMVLLQRSDTDGFGLGSGGSNLLSGRATANLMTRTTAILAALFIMNSLALSVMASNRSSTSLVDTIEQEQSQAVEKPIVPVEKGKAVKAEKSEKKAAPAVPTAGEDVKPQPKAKPTVKPGAADEASDASETE